MSDLNLNALVRLSGVSEHLIRAWERRYQALTPKRLPNGRRLYSLEDLRRLQLLARLVAQGHAIGGIAQQSNAQLQSLAHRLNLGRACDVDEQIQRLIYALRTFNMLHLDEELRASRFRFSARNFVLEIVGPLIQEIGNHVAAGELSIAQGHIFAAVIRDHLGDIYRTLRSQANRAYGQTVALSTPSGNWHEFGVLISAILFASAGWDTHYQGPNLPASELAQACKSLDAQVVVLGCSLVPDHVLTAPLPHYLCDLDQSLAQNVNTQKTELWAGGEGFPHRWQAPSGRKVLFLPSLIALEDRLHKLN